MGQCHLSQVTILTGDATPISQRPYQTPLMKRAALDRCIDEVLRIGSICPSTSPWDSPIILVQKKDHSDYFKIATDFRALSLYTVKDRYPLPNIQDIFNSLGGKAVNSSIDMKLAFK